MPEDTEVSWIGCAGAAVACALGANDGVNVLADGLKLKLDALGLRPPAGALGSAGGCACGCSSISSQESAMALSLSLLGFANQNVQQPAVELCVLCSICYCFQPSLCGLCIGSRTDRPRPKLRKHSHRQTSRHLKLSQREALITRPRTGWRG